ncbi:hypothetical protein MHU86_25082 [Fragilaria crotonensis]|nr:hypothetical protein MHU86_25082 [Fragilaria crotonensis]
MRVSPIIRTHLVKLAFGSSPAVALFGTGTHDAPQAVYGSIWDRNSTTHRKRSTLRKNYILPLIDAQKRIGWRQLFNGRFCQHWADIQNTHLYEIWNQFTKDNPGKCGRQVTFIMVIWKEWHKLWIQRNADVHGKDEATRAINKEKQEMTRKLKWIYDQRNNMERSAQALLFPDVRTHLEQPSWVIQTWLTINGPTFIQSLHSGKAKAIQNVRSIREYYAPAQG